MFMHDYRDMSGRVAVDTLVKTFRFTPEDASNMLNLAYRDMSGRASTGPAIGFRKSGTVTFATHRDTRVWQVEAVQAAFVSGTRYGVREVCNCQVNRDRWGGKRSASATCPVHMPLSCHVQYCADGADVTGDYCAESDAPEARVWTDTGDLLGAATRNSRGYWHVSGGDGQWTRKSRRAHVRARDAILSLATDNREYRAIVEAFAA